MCLTKTLILWFQMQKSRINQVRKTVQQMIYVYLKKIMKNKINKEESGLAISSQLVIIKTKYWSEKSKNPVVVNKIPVGLKIPASCSGVLVYVLIQVHICKLWLKIGKTRHLMKELIGYYRVFKKSYFLLHKQSLK